MPNTYKILENVIVVEKPGYIRQDKNVSYRFFEIKNAMFPKKNIPPYYGYVAMEENNEEMIFGIRIRYRNTLLPNLAEFAIKFAEVVIKNQNHWIDTKEIS